MKALHVFPLFGADLPNGSERYAFKLTKTLQELGVQVEVFTTCTRRVQVNRELALTWPDEYPPGASLESGVPITRFPTSMNMPWQAGAVASDLLNRHRLRHNLGPEPDPYTLMSTQSRAASALMVANRGPVSPALYRATWRALPRYDLVLASFFPLLTIPVVVRLARRRRKPAVALPLFHAADRMNNARVLGESLQQASATLCLTRQEADSLSRLWPGASTFEVGAGIDPPPPGISGARFRAAHGLGDRPIILFVGRKEPGKRYAVAVEAMAQVSNPEAVLVMAGEDSDHAPITSPRVRYLGFLSEAGLWDAFDACDIFVLPSRHESFGMVFLQAWMCGKPVIGESHVIEHEKDGYRCGDAAEIAVRIDQLLAEPGLRHSLGEAGRRKTLERYTWPEVARKTRGVYESVIAARRS